ncbi:hypothetical protein DFJ43DRAFT_1044522 [Lentinula guzmanii]|uniref:Uncharacterized protein n=1 Tax=Lentinula guzmanii TaxID=2804957 RepID=A0AA38MQD7_9AGAR|nr:hypothetical protein DFJ43DRAFT_1044522 [Lentinula guzmanii]
MPPQTRNQGKRQMRSQGNLQSVTLSTVPQAKVKAKPSGPRTRKSKMNITDERSQPTEDGREQEEHEQPAKAKHKLPAQAKHSHKGAEEVQEQEEGEEQEQEQDEQDDNNEDLPQPKPPKRRKTVASEQDEQDDDNEDLPQPKPPKRRKTVASRVSHSGPDQSMLNSIPRPFLATAFAEPLSLISAPDDLEEDDDGLSAAVLARDVEKVASICQVYRNKAWAHTPKVARPTEIQEYVMQNDPLGAVGVFLHASYMFRELTGNFLPKICHTYTQRFSDPLSLEGIMWRNMDAIMTLNTEELEKQANAQRALNLEPSRPTQSNRPSTREDPLMLTQQAVDKGKGKKKAVEDDKPNDESDVEGHGPGKSKDRGTSRWLEGNGDIDDMFGDDDGDDHDESGLKRFGPLPNKLKSIMMPSHHGEQQKPENQLEDPEARSEALKDQIEWYEANLEPTSKSEAVGQDGKDVEADSCPVIDMSQKYIVKLDTKLESESVVWVGTDTLESVKTTHGTQMITQSNCRTCPHRLLKADMVVSVQKMVENNIDKHLIDSGAFNFEPSKLQPTLFVDNAWRAKCRMSTGQLEYHSSIVG